MTDEADELRSAFRDAMHEVFDAYIDAGRGPQDSVVEAYSMVLGCSHNEFKRLFGKYARMKGSNLFFAHYPAFGEPGCEYEPPRDSN